MDAKTVGTGMAICTASARARHGFEMESVIIFWLERGL